MAAGPPERHTAALLGSGGSHRLTRSLARRPLRACVPIGKLHSPNTHNRSGIGLKGTMDRRCPYCGISAGDQVSCVLCGTRLVRVNLRRTLLWALVAEEYLLLVGVMLRLG